MLTTEAEAEKKWCCMARSSYKNDGSLCAASRCMAWRWSDKIEPGKVILTLGYCGMAGKPLDDGSMKA